MPKVSDYEPTPDEIKREEKVASECGATIVGKDAFDELVRGGTVFNRREVTTPASITRRPEPRYTGAAREYGVSGTVRLRLLLGTDGKISHIAVLDRLPYGLTRESIRAACGIRFRPAIRDGSEVAQHVMVMYSFRVYERGFPVGGFPAGIPDP